MASTASRNLPRIYEQQSQLDKIFDLIDKLNPTMMLPSMVNPAATHQQDLERNHASGHAPEQRTVGVYSSKTAAAAAAGNIPTNYGTFDNALQEDFQDDHVDNRNNPPDSGCLVQLGSEDVGEGDTVQLMIEKFPLIGEGGVAASRNQQKATSTGGSYSSDNNSNKGQKVTSGGQMDLIQSALAKYSSQRVEQKEDNASEGGGNSNNKRRKVSAGGPITMKKSRKIDDSALMDYIKDYVAPSKCKHLKAKMQKLVKKVEAEAAQLRQATNHVIVGANPESPNLFVTSVGQFYSLFDTRTYMRARLALADFILDEIAHDATLEAVVWHYQEMLRLSSSDNLGLRFRFPFLLLRLNRDDDAFCFVRYWIIESLGTSEADKRHAESQEDDWLYGDTPGARFLSIFPSFSAATYCFCSVAFLVALACIKMRIISQHNAMDVAGQQSMLDKILDLIDKLNPTMMLPSMVNPAPLLSQAAPDYKSPGRPSECYFSLKDSLSIWRAIPGASRILQNRHGGKKPKYNSRM